MRKLACGFIVAAGMALTAPVMDDSRVEAIFGSRLALCHGMEGESASPVYPRLAAQHPEYMVKQLRDFREGRRKGTMNEMAADLKDEEITALADYFSKKPPRSRRAADADFAAVGKFIFEKGNRYSGVAACSSCHGPKGHGTVQLPRLAGQNPRYIETQIKEFNQRVRTNDNAVMHAIASKLSELEVAAVATYIGGLE